MPISFLRNFMSLLRVNKICFFSFNIFSFFLTRSELILWDDKSKFWMLLTEKQFLPVEFQKWKISEKSSSAAQWNKNPRAISNPIKSISRRDLCWLSFRRGNFRPLHDKASCQSFHLKSPFKIQILGLVLVDHRIKFSILEY